MTCVRIDRRNIQRLRIDSARHFRHKSDQLPPLQPVANQPVRKQDDPHSTQRGNEQRLRIIGRHQRRDGIVHPILPLASHKPAIRARRTAIHQAFMLAQLGRVGRYAVLTQIRGRRGKMVALLPEDAGVERRVRQRADAKNEVGGIPVRVDKVIGQRQLYG